MTKWDERFMELARLVASWSKDPSTKVGAVIVRPNRTVAAMGYNGFPRGVEDSEDRYLNKPLKYQLVVHAEANAIVSASEPLAGYVMYATLFPCCDCAKLIIQSGIRSLVVPQQEIPEQWAESMKHSTQMFFESGVVIRRI
jgi:dCMP deaminase